VARTKVANGAATAVRPILKWAGGKRQLLPALRPFYPPVFNRYIEPFVGSGAVFLDLYNAGLLEGREVRLSDINADLVGCYRAVRDGVDDVIDELQRLEAGHRAGGPEHYYKVRDERFNPVRGEVHAGDRPADRYTPALAAMLIYLNRAGYNGLFRVNAHGAFNVPAGRHASLTICHPDNLRRLAAALQTPHLSLDVRPFHDALAEGAAGDFVYLDPPYAPISRTASFTSYTAAGFGPGQQEALQRAVIDLADRGAHVLLSNSVAPEISALYEDNVEARGAGLTACRVEARRAINSSASRRGPVLEYVISNVAARHRPWPCRTAGSVIN
jgi:DNA adenine methylase